MKTIQHVNASGQLVDVLCFDLESSKAINPPSGKQIKYAESLAAKTGSKLPSTSQIAKYCEMETISEAIDAMKEGKQIELS